MDEMISKVAKLAILREAYIQLQDKVCTDVSGNPVSVVPVFALQVLYSLGWGGASDLGSIMNSGGSKMSTNTAVISINFSVEISGEKKQVAIKSTWIQDDYGFRISNDCNGKKIKDQKFSFSSEREKFENAGLALKDIVNYCILETEL